MGAPDMGQSSDALASATARIAVLEAELRARGSQPTARLDQEERLRFMLSASGVGAWDYDAAAGTLELSSTCKAIFGVAPEAELDHRDLLAAMLPEDLKAYRQALGDALEGSRDLDIDYRFRRPDGLLRWVEVHGRTVLDPDGRKRGVSGIAIDVTRRRQAEAGIVEQEARYRAITDSIDQMIWSTLPDGFHDFYNHRWYEYTGMPIGSTDGEAWNGMFHPDDQERAWATWRHCLATGETYHIEYRLRHRSGIYRWVLGRAQPVRDAAGAIVRWYGTCTDIDDSKRADERVREVEERYRLAASATRDAIWEWDFATGAVTWNEALQALFGHEILLGEAASWMHCVHPDDRERVETSIHAAIDGKATRWSEDYRFARADGTFADVFDRGFIARGPDGEALRMIGAMQDVTERRQVEAELRRLNETLEDRVAERTEELAASNRQLVGQIEERERVAGTLRQMQRLEAVGQLTSGVAHDFNNLLTVILGNLGFLRRGVSGMPNEEKLVRRLGFMELAAERGAKLTAQLLAFSRRQRLEPKALDLNASVASLQELLRSTMGGASLIETNLSEDLWTAFVDPTQIELVILNLALNARDAMEMGGTLRVTTGNATVREPARRPEEPDPGEYVLVAIRDTGQGMSEEVRAKVFEPFFTTKGVGKGTGLGLSQVLGFAKQSGGGVRVDSSPGEGTSVSVYLPRAHAVVRQEPSVSADVASGAQSPGATVLLVDDDDGVREVTASLLRDKGFTVMEAGSGGAGLDLLDRAPGIDLLLVDFAMPGMNGAEVAEEAQRRRPGLPTLFVTGYADLEAVRSIGGDRIVAKPFLPERLFRAIETVLAARPDRNRAVSRP